MVAHTMPDAVVVDLNIIGGDVSNFCSFIGFCSLFQFCHLMASFNTHRFYLLCTLFTISCLLHFVLVVLFRMCGIKGNEGFLLMYNQHPLSM